MLASTVDEEAAPRWSGDGRQVVFTVNDIAIDVVTVATGARQRLVTATGTDKFYGPAFGPDNQPSYVRLRGADADLMVGDQQLTRGRTCSGSPRTGPATPSSTRPTDASANATPTARSRTSRWKPA
ncbi:hypothetical protein GCM10029964_013280 [Kibdelosporangium lantanae]